ncbi:MAG TPA: methionyl-tRNA formyltransferase [Peptococcaceae bacterium]|nr:methionyl-tRNA formyltransferase [Peptococcaceae bacterium]
MRIIFMGTPELAAHCLDGLAKAGYELPLVVTQPDRPKGRGQKLAFSPVKEKAMELGLPVFQPRRVREAEAVEFLRQIAPDVIVVAAFGQILPKAILDIPPLGCINVHASLLPAYRGAAPIQWVLLNGERETGITIMKMEEGLDTGPMLLQKKLRIPDTMTGGQLYDELSSLGRSALLEALPLWAEGRLEPIPQPAENVSYAVRLERNHEVIQWGLPATRLINQIRAFQPEPGAFTYWQGKEIKILEAQVLEPEEEAALIAQFHEKRPEQACVPGMVIGILRKKGLAIKTGQGALLVTCLKPVGKQPMDGGSFINGYRVETGDLFQDRTQ